MSSIVTAVIVMAIARYTGWPGLLVVFIALAAFHIDYRHKHGHWMGDVD